MSSLILDPDTFGGLSVGHHIAFRSLSQEDSNAIKQRGAPTLGRVSTVMSRISFIDNLRYLHQVDFTDAIECMEINDLEMYLLCTCLDTLSGRKNYFDLQNWLKAKNNRILGIQNRQKLLETAEKRKQYLSPSSFRKMVNRILEIYNNNYGINRNVNDLLLSLPDKLKKEFTDQYVICKENQKDAIEKWKNKSVDEKLKIIFVEYLFKYRRNKYTHEGRGFRTFGGICVMREAMSEGSFNLAEPETHRFPSGNTQLVITCNYGDEAIFLREVIIACIANMLGILDDEWIDRYRKAEIQKRMLYALVMEIKYNIKVMQGYLRILTEDLRIIGDGHPKFTTKVARVISEQPNGLGLPIYEGILEAYIQSAAYFNENIDTEYTGRHPFAEVSKEVIDLLDASEIRSTGIALWLHCDKLLEKYPHWTYR